MVKFCLRALRNKLLPFITIVLFPVAIHAQVITLDSVLAAIHKNNPSLKSFDSRISAMDAYAHGARNRDAPLLGAGFWMTPYNFQPGMGSVMISATQMITNSRKLDARENYMKSLSKAESANKNFTLNELYARAKSTYYDWQILKNKEKILDKNIQLLGLMIKVSESRYPQGKEKLSNIYKAKAELYTMNDMLLIMKSMISEKIITLNTLMNVDKNRVFDIDTVLNVKDYDKTFIDSASIERKSDLQSLDQQISIMKLNQSIEKSARLPDFGIKYDHMTSFGDQPAQFNLMAMMTVPIVPWASKEYKARYEAMNYEVQGFQQQKTTIINETIGDIKMLQARMSSKKQQITLYRDQLLPALKNAYEASLNAYSQNTEELNIVLSDLEALNKANLDYFDRLSELIQLQTEYEKLLEIK
jgi:outer membrane protein, heavy metal efflux system